LVHPNCHHATHLTHSRTPPSGNRHALLCNCLSLVTVLSLPAPLRLFTMLPQLFLCALPAQSQRSLRARFHEVVPRMGQRALVFSEVANYLQDGLQRCDPPPDGQQEYCDASGIRVIPATCASACPVAAPGNVAHAYPSIGAGWPTASCAPAYSITGCCALANCTPIAWPENWMHHGMHTSTQMSNLEQDDLRARCDRQACRQGWDGNTWDSAVAQSHLGQKRKSSGTDR
jgi:hypothetical protein